MKKPLEVKFIFNKIMMLLFAGVLLPTYGFAAKPYVDHGSFLPVGQAINSYKLLPPPPEYNSTQFLTDESGFLYGRSLINTSRWETALDYILAFKTSARCYLIVLTKYTFF